MIALFYSMYLEHCAYSRAWLAECGSAAAAAMLLSSTSSNSEI